MKWTKEKPTEEGWYWTKHPGLESLYPPQIVNIYESASGLRIKEIIINGYIISPVLVEEIDSTGHMWAGPLPEVEE